MSRSRKHQTSHQHTRHDKGYNQRHKHSTAQQARSKHTQLERRKREKKIGGKLNVFFLVVIAEAATKSWYQVRVVKSSSKSNNPLAR
jgi:hypothetical protein